MNYNDSNIIVKFTKKSDKQNLFRAIAQQRRTRKSPIQLSEIGFNSTKFIYVNESLTKRNYQLLRQALRLKKQNLISSSYTRNGQLYIQKSSADSPILIKCANDLDKAIGAFAEVTNRAEVQQQSSLS